MPDLILETARTLVHAVDPTQNVVVTGAVVIVEIATPTGEMVYTMSTRQDVPWYTLGLLAAGQVFTAQHLNSMAAPAYVKKEEHDGQSEFPEE